jgi:FG-GAP repeat
MKFVRFVCLFAILISMLVLAQSNRAPLGNQPTGLPIAQQRHPALPPNLSHMPYGALFAQHRAAELKAAMPRRDALPALGGLNFAPAVTFGSGGVYADSVAVADVNGDGKPDLLVANQCADSNCNNGSMGVLLGIPRTNITSANVSITCKLPKRRATRSAKHSRLYSSITTRTRSARPSCVIAFTKSWIECSGSGDAKG